MDKQFVNDLDRLFKQVFKGIETDIQNNLISEQLKCNGQGDRLAGLLRASKIVEDVFTSARISVLDAIAKHK